MAKTIFSKDAEKFVLALAAKLKEMSEFEVPEWAGFVKSGVSRERPPVDDDFWYIRAASVLRQLYIKGVVGVGRLRTRYGSRKDRGGKACKFRKASGKIIRVILQQSEAAGLVEKVDRSQHGRRLTQDGKDLLDSIEVEERSGLDFESVAVKSVLPVVAGDEVVDEGENGTRMNADDANSEEVVEDVVEVKNEVEKDGE